MRRLLKIILPPLLLIALIWLVALGYFLQTSEEVTSISLFIGFVLAPFTAVLTWFTGKMAFLAVRNVQTEPAITAPAQAQTETTASPEPRPLAILAVAANTNHGEALEDLVTAIQTGEIRPELSTSLLTRDGTPLMCAFHQSVDCSLSEAFVEDWLKKSPDEHPCHSDPELGLRMLGLLEPVVRNAIDRLIEHKSQAYQSPESESTVNTPVLIKLFIKNGWEDFVEAWLRPQLASIEGVSPGFIRAQGQNDLHHDVWRVSNAFKRDLAQIPPHSLLLLIGCDSFATQACIDELEQKALLFSATQQTGLIPGEAAAAVIMGLAEHLPEDARIEALVHETRWANRAAPLSNKGKADPATLEQLFAELMTATPEDTAPSGCLISDCDHRAAWAIETASFISATQPELDAVADHLAIGQAFGHTGMAASALTLACGAAWVHENARSALAACVHDVSRRSLALLRPAASTRS